MSPERRLILDSGASEHAVFEWSMLPSNNIFTGADAKRVPTIDRIGKKRAWEMLYHLPETFPLDITTGTHFKWWLWVANLADRTHEVIGDGIASAVVTMCDCSRASFTFTHVDGSECYVDLQWHDKVGFKVYIT